jgi:hypothetical protein
MKKIENQRNWKATSARAEGGASRRERKRHVAGRYAWHVTSERPSEARNLGYRCDHPSRAATRHIALLPVRPELKAGRAPTIPTASSLPCENPDVAEISSDFADVNIK